jgi:hypothetical protein
MVYPEPMKFSAETSETMKSPVAKIALTILGAATLVMFIQILLRVL